MLPLETEVIQGKLLSLRAQRESLAPTGGTLVS
jgi:hypothetical protein